MTTTTSQRFRMLHHLCWCNGKVCPWKKGKHHGCVYTFYFSKTGSGWSCIITVKMVVVPNFSIDSNINWNKSFFKIFKIFLEYRISYLNVDNYWLKVWHINFWKYRFFSWCFESNWFLVSIELTNFQSWHRDFQKFELLRLLSIFYQMLSNQKTKLTLSIHWKNLYFHHSNSKYQFWE